MITTSHVLDLATGCFGDLQSVIEVMGNAFLKESNDNMVLDIKDLTHPFVEVIKFVPTDQKKLVQ